MMNRPYTSPRARSNRRKAIGFALGQYSLIAALCVSCVAYCASSVASVETAKAGQSFALGSGNDCQAFAIDAYASAQGVSDMLREASQSARDHGCIVVTISEGN